jgi:hypothetical protein
MPATIHETAIESGRAMASRHYCQAHGESARSMAPRLNPAEQRAALAALIQSYDSLTETERSRLRLDHRLARLR